MSDIVAFIRARLDEDAEIANDLDRTDWRADGDLITAVALTGGPGRRIIAEDVPETLALHIARHDPARVLRDVEAKRRILAMHEECGYGAGYCDDGGHGWDGLCHDKLYLALPYADHPDYDEAWRP